MAHKKIRLLYAPDDQEALAPILAQLNAKGVKCSEKAGQIVLAVLSENLYADPEKTQALLNQLGASGQNILPLQLDRTPIPEVIMNALFASNIIPAVDREPEQIAQRIIDALPATKNPLPKIFIAGALVLAVLIGIFLLPPDTEPEVPDEPQIELPAGLTQDELEDIRCVVLIGDEFYHFTDMPNPEEPLYEQLASYSSEFNEETNGLIMHWYSHQDGSEVQLQEYDLSFLSMMPNLRSLQLVKVKVTNAPDLSAHENIVSMMIVDCEIDDLQWVAKAPIRQLFIRSDADCSPLSESQTLENFQNNEFNSQRRDWSNFSPPNLKEFHLAGGSMIENADLSGLAQCTQLNTVTLTNVDFSDMSFLQNAKQLEMLNIWDNNSLQDISPIANCEQLQRLSLTNCPGILDMSPVSQCLKLQWFELEAENAAWKTDQYHDLSFLGELPELCQISLQNVDLANLDFLNALSRYQDTLTNLWISGTVADWSGLAAVERYENITLANRIAQTENDFPYLGDVQLGSVQLRNFDDVDLANLPNVAGPLIIQNCGIRNLSSISQNWTTPSIQLVDCNQLSSLDGLQTAGWGSGKGTLYLYNCPRLNDWSALKGMTLKELSIIGGYSVPDFGTFRVQNLRLDTIGDVEDLTFLDSMDAEQACNITLVGLENVNNLRPLERLHGSCLAVSPQLAEQAEELVKSGNFQQYSIEYPMGGWEMDNSEIELMSLEELSTLSKALLHRVSRLALVGDMLVDLTKMQIVERPGQDGEPLQLVVVDWQTGEETIIDPASGFITDLSQLQELTGLKELQLWGQPLESLEGIHNFSELMQLTVAHCPNLTDAAYAFTMQNLQVLNLRYCPVQSIQGVQNLWNLGQLDISYTEVTDLSPLAQCNFSNAIAQMDGVTLLLDGIQVRDFSALASINRFALLSLNHQNANLWLEHLLDKQILRLYAADSFQKMQAAADVNGAFAEFMGNHPELMELQLQGNNRLTDVSVLVEMPSLQYVSLSEAMEAAIESVGVNRGFVLGTLPG